MQDHSANLYHPVTGGSRPGLITRKPCSPYEEGITLAQPEGIQQTADRVYKFYETYLKENAKPPTHREVVAGLHISTETLAKSLNHLEESGRAIHRVRGRGRQVWVPINQQPEED